MLLICLQGGQSEFKFILTIVFIVFPMKYGVRRMPEINLFRGSLFTVYLQLNKARQLGCVKRTNSVSWLRQTLKSRIQLAGLSRWGRWVEGLAVRRSCHSAPECTLQSSSKPEWTQQTQTQIHFTGVIVTENVDVCEYSNIYHSIYTRQTFSFSIDLILN